MEREGWRVLRREGSRAVLEREGERVLLVGKRGDPTKRPAPRDELEASAGRVIVLTHEAPRGGTEVVYV